jgi:TolB protein
VLPGGGRGAVHSTCGMKHRLSSLAAFALFIVVGGVTPSVTEPVRTQRVSYLPGSSNPQALSVDAKRVRRGEIVFNRFFDSMHETGALFTVKVNGRGVRKLTYPPRGGLDEEPVWSPDGRYVAFQRVVSGGTAVYLVGADGRGERLLMHMEDASATDSPAWSPDGSKLALALHQGGREVIAIVSTDGRLLAQITQRNTGTKFIDSQPGWSPSGRRLTFVRQTAHPSRNGLQALFVVNRDGSHARRLSPLALRAGHHPDWSPLGGRIVFTSNADGADPNRPSNIYSIRPNGKGLRQLTRASAGQLYLSSSYSPDGHWLTFAMEPSPNANAQVFVMRSNGTGRHTVTGPDAWSSAPDWSFRG